MRQNLSGDSTMLVLHKKQRIGLRASQSGSSGVSAPNWPDLYWNILWGVLLLGSEVKS